MAQNLIMIGSAGVILNRSGARQEVQAQQIRAAAPGAVPHLCKCGHFERRCPQNQVGRKRYGFRTFHCDAGFGKIHCAALFVKFFARLRFPCQLNHTISGSSRDGALVRVELAVRVFSVSSVHSSMMKRMDDKVNYQIVEVGTLCQKLTVGFAVQK